MNFQTLTNKLAVVALAFSSVSLWAQIPEPALDSIFDRMNGEDYDARYAAKIELQDFVTDASSPESDTGQRLAVEKQLLDRLASEPLLTNKLWIIRQLNHIGGPASVPALEALLDEEERLAVAARKTLEDLPVEKSEVALKKAGLAGSPPIREPLLPEKLSASKLATHALEDVNRSVRFEAFSRLLEKAPRKAKAALENTLKDGDPHSQLDFLGAVMDTDKRMLRNYALDYLQSAPPSHQLAILAGLRSSDAKIAEPLLLSLEIEDSELLNTSLYAALGTVGSFDSLERLLSGIESKSRTIADAAADALARIEDKRIDEKLREMAASESPQMQILAIEAMSYRAVPDTSERITEMVADQAGNEAVREAAIEALETVGTVESLPTLISIVIDPADKKLLRDAQQALKRMTLRLSDPQAAWAAFKAGLDQTKSGSDEQIALLRVIDSAPTEATISYLLETYKESGKETRDTILRVLPSWRNWEGGYALLEIASNADDERRLACFQGIGKLILGSDATYPLEGKFALSDKALKAAEGPEERSAVIDGFRYSTWRERVHVTYNQVDPELKEAVLKFAIN